MAPHKTNNCIGRLHMKLIVVSVYAIYQSRSIDHARLSAVKQHSLRSSRWSCSNISDWQQKLSILMADDGAQKKHLVSESCLRKTHARRPMTNRGRAGTVRLSVAIWLACINLAEEGVVCKLFTALMQRCSVAAWTIRHLCYAWRSRERRRLCDKVPTGSRISSAYGFLAFSKESQPNRCSFLSETFV